MEQIPTSPGGSLKSHYFSLRHHTLQSGRGMARQVYTNASKKYMYSQNVDSKLGSYPCCLKVENMYKPS